MSSIPLPALSIRPPAQPDLLGDYAKAVQIRNLMQAGQQQAALAPGQLQQQQQQIQASAQSLKDQQAATAALKQWDGKDVEEIPGLILKNGGSANAVFGAKNQILEQKTKLSTLDKDTLANQASKNNFLLGSLQAATQGDDQGLAQRVTGSVQDAVSKGYLDPQHAQALAQMAQSADPATLRSNLSLFEKSLMGQKEQFDQVQKERTTKAAEETAASRQATATTSAERLKAELPGGALQSVDKAEMQSWLADNPGKKASDFLAYKASLAPQAQQNVQSGMLQGPARDMAAENYFQTGQMPSGMRSPTMSSSIINRAAELHPNATQDLASNRAAYQANTDSLKKLQSNFDQVTAFENTAGKNLDQFLSTAKKVVDSGSPWVNAPLRAVNRSGLGDADQAAFDAARATALTEIAKVLNSSNASGVLSDSARGEVNSLIGPNASLKQIVSAANILKQDMGNRHQAYQQQIGDIQKRLGGAQGGGPASNSGAPSKPANATHTGVGSVDGKKHWLDANGNDLGLAQ